MTFVLIMIILLLFFNGVMLFTTYYMQVRHFEKITDVLEKSEQRLNYIQGYVGQDK